MMIDTSFRLIFLLFVFSFKFSFAQLTTFTETALERPFEYPSNTLLVNPPNSSTDFIITIDTNNIFNQILPSHFGLNFPHFIGDNVLEEESFLTHTSNLSSMYYRIPGGSGSDRYFWDGNIPNAIREDAQINVDDLLDATDYRIGPNEYMNVIEDLNSNAIVVVNAGYARYGIAENKVQVAAGYAADFVRHLNVTLGKNIKYWEVGNELYGSWEAGHEVDGNAITGSEYGDIFNVFVDSMKAADPNIKIGAVCYPIDEAYNYWTRGVLQKVENTADFLIIHDYFKRKPNPNNVSYQEMLYSVAEVQQDVNNMRNMVSNYTSKGENYFPIAMTEFNSKTGEREIAMANALFITNVLAEQIKHGIQMSLLWNLENGLGQDGGDHGVLARNSLEVDEHTPRPTYYAYYLMQKYFGDKMIFCYSPDTTVISYSTMFANDGLGIVLINTSDELKTVELSSNYYKSDYFWHELYADDEIDKKVYINGQTSNSSQGGPLNYSNIASYYRPYENDSKFELKPYSITFIANIGNNSATNTTNRSNSIELYPNPTSTNINIEGDFCEYVISSLDGKKIFSGHEYYINTTLFKPGVYFITFKYLNKFNNQKIIIK